MPCQPPLLPRFCRCSFLCGVHAAVSTTIRYARTDMQILAGNKRKQMSIETDKGGWILNILFKKKESTHYSIQDSTSDTTLLHGEDP